ncbi:MAG: ABC transporter substrate-binding protein, partial [Euryarchaeota archaeon]|nr:ABC transporter substrate-binding protein [Euryarchaeota archaeon]
MAQSHNRSVRRINRRRLLQGMGAAGMVGVAGCLGGNGDDDGENGDGDGGSRLDELEEPEVDFADLQEGGTLSIGVTENVDSFDPPYSTDANSTQAQVFVFEQLTTTDREGNIYPWLAESYEEVDTQDIDRTAYEDYMISVSVDEDGIPDTEEQILIQHPEDDPEEGEVRILTPEEAEAAVEDGVFGMQFRYELREGIEFHDGEELTAENVVLSAQRYENSDLSAQTFDSLLLAQQVDEYTV